MTEMVALLSSGAVSPEGIIATTFTKKAAAELEERVRIRLLEEGMPDLADRLTGSLIGTVHSLGVKLLKRFAFEAGVSPSVSIIADDDQQLFFNQSLATILTEDRVEEMEDFVERLGLRGGMKKDYDWRGEIRTVIDMARANGFGEKELKYSKEKSLESLFKFFPPPSKQSVQEFDAVFLKEMERTLAELNDNEKDKTKNTNVTRELLADYIQKLQKDERLNWEHYAKIIKTPVGAKSREIMNPLRESAQNHEQHPLFLKELGGFIGKVFDLSILAIFEYEQFKKKRGLIDYTDMETLVKDLLNHPEVGKVLGEEVELLLVDEFQDTSPLQLEIFYKLSRMADHCIWVGDPKQSIYGFRGTEPELMEAVIKNTGGIRPEDIQEFSWRSRQDIVNATNAIFTKAFNNMPAEQVRLIPKRKKKAHPESSNQIDEPMEMGSALHHWHFEQETGKQGSGAWFMESMASAIREFLEREPLVLVKGTDEYRKARPGDVAVLCKSNKNCAIVAESLHRQGLRAAIARTGLLQTPEVKLVLAALKYLSNKNDSLSIAEILYLGSSNSLSTIVDTRIQYLNEEQENGKVENSWGYENKFIQKLDALRTEITELSGAEILSLILEELDIRQIILSWGNVEQRLDNIGMIRNYANQYEEACHRLQTGASLGGFLLWLHEKASSENDQQGFSQRPDAVNVLTYHKSKGLEWPIVLCYDLESGLRDKIWGAEIVSESDEVDLDHLTANRYIRFWKHPYGNNLGKTPFEERLGESPEKKLALEKALQEEARVMYVGITRARDYLIFPTRKKSTLWLNRVWHGAASEKLPTLLPDNMESPWDWGGEVLMMDKETRITPVLLPNHPIPASEVTGLSPKKGTEGFLPLVKSSEEWTQAFKLFTKEGYRTTIPGQGRGVSFGFSENPTCLFGI